MEFDLDKFSAKKPSKQERRQRDLELWNQWDQNGRRKEDMGPLFTQFRGMIHSKSREWTGLTEIPPVAVKAAFNAQFVNAVNSFDPSKGTLHTWVGSNLQGGNRWLKKHQNIARIPETRSGAKIGQFKSTRAHLDEALGREPTTFEMAESLGWSPKEVSLLESELRQSHVRSGFEIDPLDIMPSKEKEAIHNVYYDLDPEEQLVYDYTLGAHGKQELRPTQIADKLGISKSKVSRLRDRIMGKLKNHL